MKILEKKYAKSNHNKSVNDFIQPDTLFSEIQSFLADFNCVFWESDQNNFQLDFVSPQIEELMGYSQKEALAPGFRFRIIHPQDLKTVQMQLTQYAGKLNAFDLEYRVNTGSGREIWVLDKIRVQYKKGKAVKLSGVMIDISSRKNTENQLARREKIYRFVTENITDLVWKINLDLHFTFVSPSVKKIFGYTIEEALKLNIKDIMDEDSFKIAVERSQHRIKTGHKDGEPEVREYRIRKKNGEWIEVETIAIVLYDEKHSPTGIAGIMKDITNRKKVENALVQSEMKYSRLYNETPVMMHSIDSDGRIIEVNNFWLATMGYSAKEIIGRKFTDFIHSESDIIIREPAYRSLYETGSVSDVEVQLKCKSGKLIDVLISSKVERDSEGRVQRSFSYILDVTEKKKTEKELVISQMQFKSFMENLPAAAYILDKDNKFVYANPYFKQLVGHQKLVSKNVSEIFPENLASRMVSENEDVIRRGFKSELEIIPDRNQELKTFQTHKFLLLEEEGQNLIGCVSVDITPQIDSIKALKQSEQSYRNLFDSAIDAIYVQDEAGIFVDVNNGALKMYGYERDYFIGKSPQFLSAPGKNDLASVQQCVKKAFEGIPQQFEFWGLRKNGEIFPKIVRLSGGTFFGQQVVFAFALDITERKNAELALIESENRYKTLIERSPYSIEIYDSSGTMIHANQAWEDLWKTSKDLVLNKFNALQNQQVLGLSVFNKIKEAFQGKIGEIPEAQFQSPHGQQISKWLHTRFYPLFDDSDNLRNVVVINEDITERKLAAEKLQKSEKYFHSMERFSGSISSEIHIDKLISQAVNEIRNIFSCDRAWLLHPCDPNTEKVSVPIESFNPEFPGASDSPKDIPAKLLKPLLQRSLESKEPLVVKYSEAAPGLKKVAEMFGTASQMSIVIHPSIGKPWLLGVHECQQERDWTEEERLLFKAIAQRLETLMTNSLLHKNLQKDIIRREKAEQEIQKLNLELENRVIERTARLENVNRELESFAYSVSHDLRAPLRAINGFADIISTRFKNELNPEGLHYFNNIIEASRQMDALINDLLTYSRVGRNALQINEIHLQDLFKSILNSLDNSIQQSKAEIELQPDLPNIRSDATLLNRIFSNLIQNAMLYVSKDKKPHVRIEAKKAKGKIILSIRDNGIGIPVDYQQKIFEIFQRLHTDEQIPGSGIGLAIVKKSVQLLNGTITLKSAPGLGTTFFVELPEEADHFQTEQSLK